MFVSLPPPSTTPLHITLLTISGPIVVIIEDGTQIVREEMVRGDVLHADESVYFLRNLPSFYWPKRSERA